MALIADLCPQCQQVTRCEVVERVSIAGGILFGIPFVLPYSSVTCSCGECGHQFRSLTWDFRHSVPHAEAVFLDLETLLSRTNPALKDQLALSELRAAPRLQEAFALLEQLTPGRLRTGLREALGRWPQLDEVRQERFLERVKGCAEAARFARSMAGRYTTGAAGCLAAVLVCLGVWSGCTWVFGSRLSTMGWVAVVAAGLMAGGMAAQFLWGGRDRRWVKEVLAPEARRSGISLGWLIVVLEDGPPSHLVPDELGPLRGLKPAVRAELAPSDDVGGDAEFRFEVER
jgi:hypothetical protein